MTRAMSSSELVHGATRAAAYCFVLALIFALAGCTFVQFEEMPAVVEGKDVEPAKRLTIIDVRVSGSAIDLSATLEGKGSLDVNREQGSTEGLVREVGEIVNPLSLP